MVSNPEFMVGNHPSGHVRAVSEISLSGMFRSNLSGMSPVRTIPCLYPPPPSPPPPPPPLFVTPPPPPLFENLET